MFSVDEIVEAARGKIVCGSADMEFSNISMDSRTIKKGDAFIAIKGDNFDGHDFIDEVLQKGATCIIGDSRVRKYTIRPPAFGGRTQYAIQKHIFIEVKDTVKALGDIAGFQRRKYDFPVIAISGSAGKTTVKEMIAWVLSGSFNVLRNEGTKNNQIGLPQTLLRSSSDHDLAVLELGTNHPGEIKYLADICQPNIGVITNIGPAHLEYFHDLNGVLKEKYSLINSLRRPGIVFLNADDALLRKKLRQKPRDLIFFSFGIKSKGDFMASDIKYNSGKLEFLVQQKHKFSLNTLGYSNIYNALVAIGVSRVFGVGYKEIIRRLSEFSFPKSRLNLIKLSDIRFIDDTYNSNPLSLRQALEALRSLNIIGRKIFIMGDMLELGRKEMAFHLKAGREIAQACDVFVAVGKLSKLAASSAESFGLGLRNIFTCKSSQEARDILFNQISPEKNDIVLVKGSRGMKMEEIFKIK